MGKIKSQFSDESILLDDLNDQEEEYLDEDEQYVSETEGYTDDEDSFNEDDLWEGDDFIGLDDSDEEVY